MSNKSEEGVCDDDICCKKRDLDENKRVQALDAMLLYGIRGLHVRRRKERREHGRRAKKKL